MFTYRSVKRNRFRKIVFITLTVLISIGLVVPLASFFVKDSGTKTGGAGTAPQQTLAERMAELEARSGENPRDTAVLMELAETYLRAGSQDQAVLTYGKIIALEPDNLEARLNLAVVNFYAGQYDQSIDSLQEILKRDPDNKEAHRWYGYVLGVGKNDRAAGVRELEKYVELAKTGIDVEKAKQDIEAWKAAINK